MHYGIESTNNNTYCCTLYPVKSASSMESRNCHPLLKINKPINKLGSQMCNFQSIEIFGLNLFNIILTFNY